MENVVRAYQAWRQNKKTEFQKEASRRLEEHKAREKAAGRTIAYLNSPSRPDLSFQAFIEEYEDSMPLDH